MKEIKYKFPIEELSAMLISAHKDLEDGHWTLEAEFETIHAEIPRVSELQQDGHLPGVITRLKAINLVRTDYVTVRSLKVTGGVIQMNLPFEEK